jgi:hypothetical protein
MSEIDQDVLRDLMHHATDDLHAPPTVAAGIVGWHHRRRVRHRVLSLTATATMVGLAAGAVTIDSSGTRPTGTAAAPVVHLTAAQLALYHLSDVAAATPTQTGLYVVQREKSTDYQDGVTQTGEKISVISTLTGGGVTYQEYNQVPGVPPPPTELTSPSGSDPTQAQYDAMPTNTAALRALLLTQGEQQNPPLERKTATSPNPPQETSDDLVFQEATNLLWSPQLSPALRSAVYKVLAATPGVIVKTAATDSAGQTATEISRFDAVADMTYETYEDPTTGATLESVFTIPHDSTGFGSDLYQSITYTNTIPPDPYGN